ncbi:MAG: MotA/TolQ/ExbB proton channel family protein [Flavobacteriales bacterium]
MLKTFFLQVTVGTQQGIEMAAPEVQQHEPLSMLDLAMKGGPIMIPIAILSVAAVYLFVERFIAINRAGKEDKDFMNNIRDFIHEGKIDAATALCKSDKSPVARMVEKGIRRLGKPLNDIQTAVENVGKLEVYKLEENLAAIATIAGAAPMLGFLGTVSGMINAFYQMSTAGNNIQVSMLAGGIYEAMVTTVAGLFVGIVAFVAYNLLVTRLNKVVNKLEARTIEFLDVLNEPAK